MSHAACPDSSPVILPSAGSVAGGTYSIAAALFDVGLAAMTARCRSREYNRHQF